jgi:hypothetical protein
MAFKGKIESEVYLRRDILVILEALALTVCVAGGDERFRDGFLAALSLVARATHSELELPDGLGRDRIGQ